MNETIYLKYFWKTKDMIKGYKYHLKTTNIYKIIILSSRLLGIIALVQGLYQAFTDFELRALFTIFLGFFYLSFKRYFIYLFSRNCKQLDCENKQVEWKIDNSKIVYRIINLSESKLSWDYIKGVLDTPEGFLLYPQKNQFYWLPKSEFDKKTDIAQFAFIAQGNVKNFQQIT